MTYITYI